MTEATTNKRICDHLEKYVFDNVWNEPYRQSRTYFKPELLNPVLRHEDGSETFEPVAGMFQGRYNKVLLPPYETEDLKAWLPAVGTRYLIYSVPAAFFGFNVVNCTEWMLFSHYCTGRLQDVTLMSKSGVVLNRNFMYLRQNDQNDAMLVAVDYAMWKKALGAEYDPRDVIFRFYWDSDKVADDVIAGCKLARIQIPGVVTSDTIKGIKATLADGSTIALSDASYVLYNGRLCYGNMYATNFLAGGYVEAVVDEDIIGKFVIDVNDLKYTYTKDGSARVIIHIPKSINKNYYMITFNTCDLWMVPTDSEGNIVGSYTAAGIKVYPAGRGEQIHQLTHNDYSIDRSLLDEIAAEVGFSRYKLVCYVRTHGKEDVFVRDGNYIDYLYNLDDDEILTFLRGEHKWQTEQGKLLFWKAENLDGSKYADAILRRCCSIFNMVNDDGEIVKYDTEDGTKKLQCARCGLKKPCSLGSEEKSVCPYFTARTIDDYIEILGYFHVLSIIGKRIHHFRVLDDNVRQIVVDVPLALSEPELSAKDWYPVVYHNGVRIPQDEISFRPTSSINTKLRELRHNDDTEITVAETVQSSNATKIMISIVEKFKTPVEETFVKDVAYYVALGEGKYRKAVIADHADDGEEVVVVPPVSSTGDISDAPIEIFHPDPDGYIGDIIDKEKFVIKNVDIKFFDTLSVELFDSRNGGADSIIDQTGETKIQAAKVNSKDKWRIYRINDGDYVAITVPGTVSDQPDENGQYTLTLSDWVKGNYKFLLVETPRTAETSLDFEIKPGSTAEGYDPGTLGYIGKGMLPKITSSNATIAKLPKYSDVLFLNNKRLIPNLDYTSEWGKLSGSVQRSDVYVQNVSYLNKGENKLDVIRTTTSQLGKQERGYLIGRYITWEGQSTLWFDELSTLVVDGKLCPTYQQIMGKITVPSNSYRNGAPYEVKTCVSQRILEIMSNESAMNRDIQRIAELSEFFTEATFVPQMKAIIPHSYKIYSVYLEEIVADYLKSGSGTVDFCRVGERVPAGKTFGTLGPNTLVTVDNFENQFSNFSYLKEHDVIFRSTDPIDEFDLGFCDVYAVYHPILARFREDYAKLSYLADKLLPHDNIKHKDAKK